MSGRSKAPAAGGPASPSSDDDLGERLLDSRVLHTGRYLTFRVDRVERADGSIATRDVCGHPGAVAILAIDDDDNILLVRQYRHPAGRVLLEIPAGTLDADPDGPGGVEDHAAAARRELEEETGHRAASLELLTSFWTAPGFATELMHLYLATGLRPAGDDGERDERRGPDEDERLSVVSLPWRVALAMAEQGEIHDGKTLVGLLWLSHLRGRIEPPPLGSDALERAVPEPAAAEAVAPPDLS